MFERYLTVISPVPACICVAERWMQSSPAVGQHCSCCFSLGTHRAGALGEPPLAPSTLDHLTVPLMTCVLLSAGVQTVWCTHTHSQPGTHTQRCCHSSLQLFSIYHSGAESASIGLCAVWAPVCLFVARAPLPHTCWGGCVCVFVCVVQSSRRYGRGPALGFCGLIDEEQQELLHWTRQTEADSEGE